MSTRDRETAYIWDIFDYQTTPIDGVLLSREQVGREGSEKFDRLTDCGIYGEPELGLPEWLPTISDCGAWGYKSLPFPPYDFEELLQFYEDLNVTTGVSIDHLVLGAGHTKRLYLDERALPDGFTESDLPDSITDNIDVMIEEWPTDWPTYVQNLEPSICGAPSIEPFSKTDFEGTPDDVLEHLSQDSRAVYRTDDTQFRYDLTLSNASRMREIFERGDYSFRLMAAIQGWGPDSYVRATQSVLQDGYRYLGIGGVAGSRSEEVKAITAAIGDEIGKFQEKTRERVDPHIFGFAKTDAFAAIGRSGVASFDSASMLRSAWTGPNNYHLDDTRRYDALRVRYPENGEVLETKIEWALRNQELLQSLRAYDQHRSIASALRRWQNATAVAIESLPDFLQAVRWNDCFHESLQRNAVRAFREGYKYNSILKGSFGEPFRRELVKLLRKDSRDDPVSWHDYLDLVSQARRVFYEKFPTQLEWIDRAEGASGEVGTVQQLWPLIESYTDFVGDGHHLDGYRELLENRPWNECGCPICSEIGIEVAIFRGNNRNRRRGFHNTRRFYNQFEEVLPKLLVLTTPNAQLTRAETVGSYLLSKHEKFWNEVYDLPVVEIGVMTAEGVHEWWEEPPSKISLDPDEIAKALSRLCSRYQKLFVHDPEGRVTSDLHNAVGRSDCTMQTYEDSGDLRSAVIDTLELPAQSRLSNY